MKIHHIDEGVGRIVKGVNTTADVGVDQTRIEAAKFGNKVDKDGRPPTLSKKVKGKSTNVLFNLGMAESKEPRYTAYEWALMEGGHTLEEPQPKKPGRIFAALEDFDDKTKAAIDKYQQSNTVGKTSRAFYDIEDEYLNIRELAMKLIKNDLDPYTAYYKASEKMQFDPAMVFDWMGSEFKDEEFEDFIPVEYERDWIKRAELGMTENFADGKKKGKSRPGRVKRSGASCKGSVTDLRKRAKKYSGERGKMYHWCANMKSGKKK